MGFLAAFRLGRASRVAGAEKDQLWDGNVNEGKTEVSRHGSALFRYVSRRLAGGLWFFYRVFDNWCFRSTRSACSDGLEGESQLGLCKNWNFPGLSLFRVVFAVCGLIKSEILRGLVVEIKIGFLYTFFGGFLWFPIRGICPFVAFVDRVQAITMFGGVGNFFPKISVKHK